MTEQRKCCVPSPVSSTGFEAQKSAPIDRVGSTQHSIEMIELDGGWFTMGANDGPHPEDGEGPKRQAYVDPFSISPTSVTNLQFSKFVTETGYQTVAEQQGWSFVFHLLVADQDKEQQAVTHAPWWRRIDGASWASPFGPDSSHKSIPDHPVTHISLPDALAYCKWSQTKLPTEAQREFAARGGSESLPFPWGQELELNGKPMANVWEGKFPGQHDKGENFTGTTPVTSHEPNSFGLYNMCGNVWEWTSDRFTRLHSPRPVKNPTGPLNGNTFVAKGGSYLCHSSYCTRYRTSSRQALDPLTTTGNVGFRVVA